MYSVRLWSVRRARGLNRLYSAFERMLVRLAPVLRAIGYQRLERPFVSVERTVKGLLFDCQMCGQCVLSSTGMSCPMNCPKNMRNGPCGGVRANGHCEIKSEMRCVWVLAFAGAERIQGGREKIRVLQPPTDRRLEGRSSWLRVVRERTESMSTGPTP
ncbi:MAG: methylenetetrahydrofolate reductase C-terminal domain-containing protein [Steroidobacteraceae bacterium]|jgi:methylene-tetrahydrofolate reductase-like protein|nr:methylenetetrahydrofolate reductase C-terminal domain-containing protein [Xanthobacteraceae bacterium]